MTFINIGLLLLHASDNGNLHQLYRLSIKVKKVTDSIFSDGFNRFHDKSLGIYKVPDMNLESLGLTRPI